MYHIEFLPTVNDSSCCSTSLSAFGGVSVLDFGHSNRCAVASYFCLNFYFPDDISYGAASHMFICHLRVFVVEVSI